MQNNTEKGILLWQQIRKDDLVALSELYNLYINSLYSYGMKYTRDSDRVKDCIHDLFLDIYKYRKTLSDVTNVEYYLYRSLKRKVSKPHFGKLKIISSEVSTMNIPQKEDSVEQVIIKEEIISEYSSRLENALYDLPVKQREVIFFRYHMEKSYEEIALLTDNTIETVRTIVYRAIKRLRANLQKGV